MYKVMQKNPHFLVKDNEEGRERARNTSKPYAYLMESTTLTYYTQRFCDLTQVGDLIDDRTYAIGMRKSIVISFFLFFLFSKLFLFFPISPTVFNCSIDGRNLSCFSSKTINIIILWAKEF